MTFKGALPAVEENEEHMAINGPRWEQKDVLARDEVVRALILDPSTQLAFTYEKFLMFCIFLVYQVVATNKIYNDINRGQWCRACWWTSPKTFDPE